MKYIVLNFLLCAIVATAFSAPLIQDEANQIAARVTNAVIRLEKSVDGLNADGEKEFADKIESTIPLLRIFTVSENVRHNMSLAKRLLAAAEKTLESTRKYWDQKVLTASIL